MMGKIKIITLVFVEGVDCSLTRQERYNKSRNIKFRSVSGDLTEVGAEQFD
jgi:hypothetical protein